MVRSFCPQLAQEEAAAQEASSGGAGSSGESAPKKAKLNSAHLHRFKGGATGDECFELVRELTEAKTAKASQAAAAKQQRTDARQGRHASSLELGAQVASGIKSTADIKKLKVAELKAVLAYRGVVFEANLLKAALVDMLVAVFLAQAQSSGSNGSASIESDVESPGPEAFIDTSDDDESTGSASESLDFESDD